MTDLLDLPEPDWLSAIAQAADLCLKPYRHAVRSDAGPPLQIGDCSDSCVVIEVRQADGSRCPSRDLELEMYRSGADLNLMLTQRGDPDSPLLWYGSHPVWMEGASGERCERPPGGAPLEAFCRRLRALLCGDA
jgi:hypothetical protein